MKLRLRKGTWVLIKTSMDPNSRIDAIGRIRRRRVIAITGTEAYDITLPSSNDPRGFYTQQLVDSHQVEWTHEILDDLYESPDPWEFAKKFNSGPPATTTQAGVPLRRSSR